MMATSYALGPAKQSFAGIFKKEVAFNPRIADIPALSNTTCRGEA